MVPIVEIPSIFILVNESRFDQCREEECRLFRPLRPGCYLVIGEIPQASVGTDVVQAPPPQMEEMAYEPMAIDFQKRGSPQSLSVLREGLRGFNPRQETASSSLPHPPSYHQLH